MQIIDSDDAKTQPHPLLTPQPVTDNRVLVGRDRDLSGRLSVPTRVVAPGIEGEPSAVT